MKISDNTDMKKLGGFVIMCLMPMCANADNLVFNGGFDMTPWDSGWVKDTSTSKEQSGSGHAIAIAEITANDSAISLLHSCFFRVVADAEWGSGTYGSASASASASITQTFMPINGCLFKMSAKDYWWGYKKGRGKNGKTCGIELCINGNWTCIHEYIQDTWAEICTTITSPNIVTGVRISLSHHNSGQGTAGYGFLDEESVWIDDIEVKEIGTEENTDKGNTEYLMLNAYPNPFTTVTSIKWSEKKENKIEIYDISGKLVETTKNNVIGNNLKSGIYFIKANNSKLTKLIKLK